MKKMKKYMFAIAVLMLAASAAFADDCGNGKDHGKGTPSCKNNGGNNGGSGGSGGTGGQGGNGGNGGNGGSSVVTNDNLNNVNLKNSNTNVNTSVNILKSKSDSNSTSNATSNSTSSASANQSQNQTQSQTATGGNASNGGQNNSQTTEFNQVHQTASAIAPDAYPTAPCRVSGSGAGSSPFFGVSFSGSKLDTECEKRETARSFALLGERTAALQVLCQTKAAKETKPTVCATIKQQ